MNYEQAKERLLNLIATNEGYLTAGLVVRDAKLAANRELVSAAAHELASQTDIIAGDEADGREWFPYSFLARA